MAATIYFAGGEDTSFALIGGANITTSSNLFRSTWSREAVAALNTVVSDPPSVRAASRLFVDTSNAPATPSAFWVHGIYTFPALGGSSDLDAPMLRLLDGSGIARLMVRGAGSRAVKISKRDAAGTFTDLVTSDNSVFPVGGFVNNQVDLHVINNATVSYGPRTDITFTAGPPGVITTSSGDFKTAGLTVGSVITISGSASNNVTATVTSATTSTLTCSATTFVAEGPGASVTISANGLAAFFINKAQVAAFAGDITTDGVSTFAQIDLEGCSTGQPMCWSEVIVSNEDTRSKNLWSIPPVAAGTSQQWLPNTVANINKAVINDTTFVSTDSDNQVSEWTTSQTPPVGGWVVDAIIQEARLEVAPTGPQHAEWTVRTDGTLATTGTISLTNSFDNFAHVWHQNPNTAADWTISDITIGTFDLGVESLA